MILLSPNPIFDIDEDFTLSDESFSVGWTFQKRILSFSLILSYDLDEEIAFDYGRSIVNDEESGDKIEDISIDSSPRSILFSKRSPDCPDCERPKSKNAKVRVNTNESAVKPEPELKNTIGCNLNPSDGPGKLNSILMKTVKTKWALNQ
ncbi:hypothetical protein Tco_0771737 [Tanacetum coccineum]|uniref:Uncharacterized protein n=1 Tax=Tanacetum coccineum TaxID=301880 RepID=A0ABQ4ZII6_9ASTR